MEAVKIWEIPYLLSDPSALGETAKVENGDSPPAGLLQNEALPLESFQDLGYLVLPYADAGSQGRVGLHDPRVPTLPGQTMQQTGEARSGIVEAQLLCLVVRVS
jgi:hypothetical protein